MSTANPLQDLLQARASEGRFHGSSSFTLDGVRALQKLSQHQLGQSGLWLVKLVQAAVAAGAPEVQVKFGRTEVMLSFQPGLDWEADALLEQVLSGELPADRALGHLVAGLRGSLDAHGEHVEWSSGKSRVLLDHKGYRLEGQAQSETFTLRTKRRARLPSVRQLAGDLRRLVRLTLDEQEALTGRCFVSPIPIIVDGREMPRGWQTVQMPELLPNDGVWKRVDLKSVSACLGLGYLPSAIGRPELPELPPELEAAQPVVTTPTYWGETFLISPRPAASPRGAISLLASLPHRSRVDLVLDGAVVESQPINRWMVHSKTPGTRRLVHHALSFRLAFALRPEEVDLGQFSAREVDTDALLEQALPEMLQLLRLVRSHFDHFSYRHVPRKGRNVAVAAIAAPGLLFAAVAGGLTLIPYGAVSAAAAWGRSRQARDQVGEALQSLNFLME